MEVQAAIAQAKDNGKVLAVHLVDSDSAGAATVWNSSEELQMLDFVERAVPGFEVLVLVRGSQSFQQFAAYHPITKTPTTVLINAAAGNVLDKIEGQMEPKEFAKRLEGYCHVIRSPAVSPDDPTAASSSSRKAQEREKIVALQKMMNEKRHARMQQQTNPRKLSQRQQRTEKKTVDENQNNRTEGSQVRETLEAVTNRPNKWEQSQPSDTRNNFDETVEAIPPVATESLLRIRLPSRATLKRTFPADATVTMVRQYILSSEEFVALGVGEHEFRLEQDVVPRREIKPASATLQELKLVPRAALHVVLSQPTPASTPASEGVCEWVIRVVQEMVSSLTISQTSTTRGVPPQANDRRVRADLAQESALRRRRAPAIGGNIRTFRNPSDDDDPEKRKKAYNGNSQETLQ